MLLHFSYSFVALQYDCKNITFRLHFNYYMTFGLHFYYMAFGLHFDYTTIAILQLYCNKSAIKVQSISLQSWNNPTAFKMLSKCNDFFAILWQSCGNKSARFCDSNCVWSRGQLNLHTLKIINYLLNLVVINQLRMIRGINYLNTSDSLRIEYSEFFKD